MDKAEVEEIYIMSTLKIPIESLMCCGLPPNYYMTERLRAIGAPVDTEGAVKQVDDPDKKNIIFSWEDGK